MTLSAATVVAFAVSGDTPTDAREWITVDLAGHPSPYRRGFVVMTESLTASGRGEELARHTRELILQELRRHQQQPADAALARAFAVANSVVFDEGRFSGGVGQQFLIGATAIVFEHHRATIAHVPPGQFVVAQDGIVYGIPDLASWLPHFSAPPDDAPTPEPLGYASWTSPMLVQTELQAGDSMLLSNATTGKILSEVVAKDGGGSFPIRHIHGRDPEKVMDAIRNVILEHNELTAAVAVISFPPIATGAQIATVADIGRNMREQWRHSRAAVRQLRPDRPPAPVAEGQTSDPDVGDAAPIVTDDGNYVTVEPAPHPRRENLQDRLIRLTERGSSDYRDTWRAPSEARKLGAPGAHGVSLFRESSVGAGDPSWRHAFPRMPFLRSPVFIGLCFALIIGTGVVGYVERGRFLSSEEDYQTRISEVDERLLAVADMDDGEAILSELEAAETMLQEAEQAGAPDSIINPRENQIVIERDDILQVVRMDDVTRIGGLPEELQNSNTSAVQTSGGIFLANGSLYRLRPESREMQLVLQSGTEVEGMTVGDLFGVAYDGELLVVTDGGHVFFAGSADGAAWHAMQLEEVNEQGAWPDGPVAVFAQNLYILVSDYRNIYSFAVDPEETSVGPVDWVLTGDRVNFNLAIDMTIDGNIYVLLEDGRVLTMLRGAQISSFDLPGFDPETDTPLAIIGGPMTGYLYVAVVSEDGPGRVIAIDREGGSMSQLALPSGFSTGETDVMSPFENLQDIAVDEASGTLYLINGDAVWTARYSLPPLPAPQGTPGASPESTPTE